MKSLFSRVFLAYWLSLLFAAGLSALVTTRDFPLLTRPERYVLIALAVLISAVAAWWVARSLGLPLRSLQSVMRRFAAGHLAARPDDTLLQRADELGAVSRAFDDMAERLSSLLSSQQHLLRELSHEMRAPLARLRVAIDLIDQTGQPRSRHIERVAQEADRLERLADGVLTYARMEQESRLRRCEPVDLADLAQLALHDVCFERQLPESAFNLDAPDPVPAQGDPALLRIAIENLLRNAAIHGATAQAIQVSVRQREARAVLEVRDHGPGVDDADLPQLFRPFSRLPRAPSTLGEKPGNGLGLAIVARVAKLHAGSARARNAEGGGLAVTLVLPVQQATIP